MEQDFYNTYSKFTLKWDFAEQQSLNAKKYSVKVAQENKNHLVSALTKVSKVSYTARPV